jgi:hypothetical protein
MPAPGTIGRILLALFLGAVAAGAEPEASGPAASPSPRPRLTLDIVRHVDDLLFRQPDLPRFEERVEVVGRSDQAALIRAFKGIDLCNGPTSGGAPTMYELRAMGPHPATPSLDLTTTLQTLAMKLAGHGSGEDHYFLYRARLPEGVRYFLHEGRIPQSSLYGPGLTFEMIQGFADASSAARAWRQLDRGLAFRPDVDPLQMPVPLWATTPCRPGKH